MNHHRYRFLFQICVVAGATIGIVNAANAQQIYWTNWESQSNSVRRAIGDGGLPTTLIEGSSGNVGPMPHFFGPTGIAVEPSLGYVYWADINGNKITRANLDGTSPVTLVSGLQDPQALAVDAIGGKIYWTDTTTDKIQRANLDGSNVQDVVTTGLLQASGLTLDVAAGKMYWSDFHADVIRRANLDGSDIQDLVTSGIGAPSGIALVGNKMYWSDWDRHKIFRSNLDGTGVEDFLTTVNLPTDLEYEPSTNRLYYLDWGTNRIDWITLDKTQQGTIVSGPGVSSLSYFDLVVPEPASCWLAFCGLSLLLLVRQRCTR
jgi:DNA-binding beta-propeller fold protein YncE